MLNLDLAQFRTASVSGLGKGAGVPEFWAAVGGLNVRVRQSRGRGVCITVMDVPHVELVNDAFGVCVVVGGGVIYPRTNPRTVTCLLHAR